MSKAAEQAKDGGQEPNPWTRPWFLASAGVVLVLVALAVVYVLLPVPAVTAPATGSGAPTTQAATVSEAASDSVCGLPAGDQRYPGLEQPTTWELQGRVAVPTDPKTVGPGRVEGHVRTCYAHNPTGALYAAANFLGTSAVDKGDLIIYRDLAAKGQLRDQYLASPPPFVGNSADVSIQIGGFRVQSYTAETVTIVLGVKISNGAFGSMTVPLKWEDGDWKLALDSLAPLSQVNDLAGFIPWSGA